MVSTKARKRKLIIIFAIIAAAAALTAVGCAVTKDPASVFLRKIFLMEYVPELRTGASIFTVALYGFLTSFHCIAMCGGTVLCLSAEGNALRAGLRFHAGRILTCTVIGAVLGMTGQVLYLNSRLKAIIPLICAVFILVMGLNLLGLFRWVRSARGGETPFPFSRLQSKSAFVMGLLTGLLPCGMLQIIQLYALETGSFLMGAVIMFVFGVASSPVLLSFGLLSGAITSGKRKAVMTVAAVIALIMGVRMLLKALRLMGITI